MWARSSLAAQRRDPAHVSLDNSSKADAEHAFSDVQQAGITFCAAESALLVAKVRFAVVSMCFKKLESLRPLTAAARLGKLG